MAPVKRSKGAPTASTTTKPVDKAATSQYPAALRFAFAVLISLITSTALYSLSSQFLSGDLATVANSSPSWLEVGGLLLWKITELGVCWIGGFDGKPNPTQRINPQSSSRKIPLTRTSITVYDTASLTLLTHSPPTSLLTLFYSIRPTSTLSSLLIDIFSTTLPFLLLGRPTALAHYPSHAPRGSLHNRSILKDPFTTLSTTLLAAAIYAITLELSFRTFLPSFLVTHFDAIRDLGVAHRGPAGLPGLLLALIPAGYASREFLFVPSTAAPPAAEDDGEGNTAFDSSTAGFVEHLYENVWGWYNSQERALMVRTVVLVTMLVGNSVVRIWSGVQGASWVGALGWASTWAVGALGVAGGFAWVEGGA
ncbi:MAG: hypothetical protein Q9160_005564 [Pyrenula sp. 1 TL-2023]